MVNDHPEIVPGIHPVEEVAPFEGRTVGQELGKVKRQNRVNRRHQMEDARSEHGHKVGMFIATLLCLLAASIILGLVIKFWEWVL